MAESQAPQQPHPPYEGLNVPAIFRDTPFDELPAAIKARIIRESR